jgi:SAM-dependent methyltransferase
MFRGRPRAARLSNHRAALEVRESAGLRAAPDRPGVHCVQGVRDLDARRRVRHGPVVDEFDAHLYRLLHRGTEGDADFYVRLCRGARDVLELGCGDGRIAQPLAEAGLRVVGLDAHRGMLDAAARRRAALPAEVGERIELVEGDLSAFDLGRCFDRVILPYCALYCVDHAAQLAGLRAARAHLRPGGRVAFDAYVLAGEPDAGSAGEPEWLTTFAEGQRVIEVFEQDHHWPEERRCEVTYLHRIREGASQRDVCYTLSHHYLWPEDVEPLLDAAGLGLDSAWQDFRGTPLGPDAEHLVVVAKVPGGARANRVAKRPGP